MLGALLYLKLTSWRGLIRSRLLRLRQPKYLVGALVGVAYIYFIFVRRGAYARPPESSFPVDGLPIVTALGALVLLLIVAIAWLLPRKSAGLQFSEAEIAFLFPAPIRRRTLIHFRLISSQVGLALTALILGLISNRWTFLVGNSTTHAVGWWLILATLNLHFTASAFAITRLLNRGITSLRRQLVVLGIVVLLVVVLFASIPAPSVSDLTSPETFRDYIAGLLASGPLSWLIAIPKLVLAPFLAADVRAFAIALLPAVLVLVAHYLWVLRMEVSFEEASLAKAEKRAARIAAIREGRSQGAAGTAAAQRPPFKLASTGMPEIAFLWKNLLSVHPFFRPRTLLIAAAVILGGCTWLARHPEYRGWLLALSGIATTAAAFTLLLGPQIARSDLRADLRNSDILKTYPLRGWQIVFGELLTPVVILTSLLWLELLAIALSFPASRRIPWLTPELRTTVVIGLAVLAPAFAALQLLVPNAVTVLFPAWTQAVTNRSEHGLDVMGQRIIFIAGQALVAVVGLVPAAVVASILYWATQWLIGPAAGALAAVAAVFAILATEVWLGVRWLGTRFEQLDLSSELRP